jgi:hypothetical protein
MLASTLKPKNVKEILTDEHWIIIMYEELQQFERNYVRELVLRLKYVNMIGIK